MYYEIGCSATILSVQQQRLKKLKKDKTINLLRISKLPSVQISKSHDKLSRKEQTNNNISHQHRCKSLNTKFFVIIRVINSEGVMKNFKSKYWKKSTKQLNVFGSFLAQQHLSSPRCCNWFSYSCSLRTLEK